MTFEIPYFGLVTSALLIFFAYKKFPIHFHLLLLTAYFLKGDYSLIFWISYLAIAAVFSIPLLRKIILTKPIVILIKKLGLLPKISETEKIALTSGTIWVDGQLFSGRPNFKWIFSQKYPHLSEEEQNFLDEEVEEVFAVLRKKEARMPTNWSRRFKNHVEKLKSGDIYQVAEVVRNLSIRDKDKGLSAGEKRMLSKARQILVSELTFALGVNEEQAEARLDSALEDQIEPEGKKPKRAAKAS